MTSSDGVPPELAFLGLQRGLACTSQTGRRHWSDQPALGFAGVDRFDDRSRVLAHSSVFGAILCQQSTGLLTLQIELIDWVMGWEEVLDGYASW